MTKRMPIISVAVILVLCIILGGLVLITVKQISAGDNETQSENGFNSEASGNTSYSAATEIKESTEFSDKTYTSETAEENALSVSGDVVVTATGITVNKTGDSDSGDNTSFYGTNSAVIAKDGATLNIKGAKITTDASGANGVFSYGGTATTQNASGDGTTVNISDSTIITKQDNSGGIMTTGGGVMNAENLTVETAGRSSAAIRSDRGGGTVTVNKGTYKTTGIGSPSIYSTADITVKNAELISTTSEGAIVEGKNSITLENCTLEDNNTELNGQSTTYKNIFLYQSMSGDADTGNAVFTAKDCIITTKNGDTIYVTNTSAVITLENNTFTSTDNNGYFLRIQKDSWGNNGSNGGNVTLNMKNQKVAGDIYVDSISTLTMTLDNNSCFEGVINKDNITSSVKLTIDKTSKIKLTGNIYLSSFENGDSTNSNIDFNGYKIYVDGKELS
ncbi:MAG: hypothetical protein J5659_03855 [Clostridia bacterium]|nr:hypothetical protein [Clostridia bacterium]